MRARTTIPMLLTATLLAAGCASTNPRRLAGPGDAEVGIASYYDSAHEGRATASGERFDPDRLTAAHPTLPFGTRVRVTNLENGRSVVVTITDRGPFHRGRVIDLSERAARRLGFVARGVARVRLDVLPG